jgi:hypothetical protein
LNRLPTLLPLILLVTGSLALGGLVVVAPNGGLSHAPLGANALGGSPSTRSLDSVAASSAAAPVPDSIVSSLLNVPGASTPTSMTYDSADGYMLLVTPAASASPPGAATMGTWSYGTGGWTELPTTSAPSPREYASLAYDAADRAAVLFGGIGPDGSFLSDTWTYSGGTWTNVTDDSGQAPSARADASMVYDAAIGAAVLFGGFGPAGAAAGNLTDTWTYEGGNWSEVSTSDSPPVEGAMAYDPAISRVVYYGGVTSLLGVEGCTSSTYEFNGTAWTDVSSSVSGTPGAIALESMTYDPSTSSVVAYGGVCGLGIAGVSVTLTASNSLWAFSGSAWTELPARQVPEATYGGDFEFDPGLPGFVLFGGVHPALIGLGSLTRQLSEESYTCWDALWAEIGPDLTSSVALAETGMNVTLKVTNAVTSGPSAYQYSGLPPGCGNATGPGVACRPTAVGNYTMSVNLTFALGLPGTAVGVANDSASTAIRVVQGMELAPLSVSLPKTEVGVPVTLRASITDGVNVSALEYDGLPGGCASMNTTTLACTPTAAGAFVVSLTATDALGVHETASTPVDVAPRLSIGSFTLSRSVLDFGMSTAVSAALAGGVGPFGVGYSGLPSGCPGGSELSITCAPSETGNFTIGIRSQDALGVSAASSVLLEVHPAPRVASFSVSDRAIVEGARATFEVGVSGGTPPFAIRYSGLPAGCSSANTTALTCVPTVSGNFTVLVNATDALGVSSLAEANLTVNVQPITNPHGGPASGIPPFAEGLVSGAVIASVLVSALLVRTRLRASERRRLAEELERGVASEGPGLAGEAQGSLRGPPGR